MIAAPVCRRQGDRRRGGREGGRGGQARALSGIIRHCDISPKRIPRNFTCSQPPVVEDLTPHRTAWKIEKSVCVCALGGEGAQRSSEEKEKNPLQIADETERARLNVLMIQGGGSFIDGLVFHGLERLAHWRIYLTAGSLLESGALVSVQDDSLLLPRE